jgi:alkylation response protein AidB-like acyl-CoA dehydrogenase
VEGTDRLAAALGAVDGLGPTIRAEAERAEAERRLTDPVVDGLAGAGLFGAVVPADLGGLDLTLPESLELFRAVGVHDASASWTLAILANGGLFGRLLGDAFAEVVVDGAARVAGTFNPLTTTAIPVDGGYRLTGTVGYASGCHHADWLMAAAWVERDGERSFLDGIPELIAGLLPIGEATIDDTWSTAGMRATGSHDCTVADVVVDRRFTFPWGDAALRPERDVWGNIPLIVQIGGALACSAVGAARGSLEAFAELAGAKMPAGGFDLLADKPAGQRAAGEAEGLVLAAEATLARAAEEAWAQGEARRPFEMADRTRFRSRVVTATQLAARAIDLLHDAAGMNAIAAGTILERAWRDVHTATQHLLLNPARYDITGRVALGRDPGSAVI